MQLDDFPYENVPLPRPLGNAATGQDARERFALREEAAEIPSAADRHAFILARIRLAEGDPLLSDAERNEVITRLKDMLPSA